MKKVLVTGHRNLEDEHGVRGVLFDALSRLRDKGYELVVCGMSYGTDIIAAEVAQELGMKVLGVSPNTTFDQYIKKEAGNDWHRRYWKVLSNTGATLWQRYPAKDMDVRTMMKNRNQDMVDFMESGDVVIGVCSDKKSGTAQTLRMASEGELEVHVYNPETKKWVM